MHLFSDVVARLNSKSFKESKIFISGSTETDVLTWADEILKRDTCEIYPIFTKNVAKATVSYDYSSGFLLHNNDTCSLVFIHYSTSKIVINSKARNSSEWYGWVTK